MNPEDEHAAPARPVALVTGAARRIGRTIARALHGAGYDLVLHYRASREQATQLAAELESARADSTLLVAAELLDASAPTRLVEHGIGRFGRLDALVNNASSFYATPVGSVTAAQWDELLGTNLRAPFFLSQAAAPALRKAGGCIVNLVDIHGERPLALHPVYSASKAALVMMTRALAVDLAPQIRVNAVAPGAILWAEHENDQQRQRAIIEGTALKRLGTPEDIAGAVLYLLRDAPYVTGHVLAVDGGRSLNV